MPAVTRNVVPMDSPVYTKKMKEKITPFNAE
jgi:hypothetical protein